MADQEINVTLTSDSSGLVAAASKASESLSNISAETKIANQHLSRISTTNRVAAKSLQEVAAASKETVSGIEKVGSAANQTAENVSKAEQTIVKALEDINKAASKPQQGFDFKKSFTEITSQYQLYKKFFDLAALPITWVGTVPCPKQNRRTL